MGIAVGLAASLAWLAWAPLDTELAGTRVFTTYTVRPHSQARFLLPQEVDLLKVVVFAEVEGSVKPGSSESIELEVEWLDPDGQLIGREAAAVHAASSAPPATLVDMPGLDDGVADPRSAIFEPPEGGAAYARVLAGDRALRIRALARTFEPDRSWRALGSGAAEGLERSAQRLGIDPKSVMPGEARAIRRQRWHVLAVSGGSHLDAQATAVLDPPASPAARAAAGFTLREHEGVVFDLVGPGTFRLLADDVLRGVSVSGVQRGVGEIELSYAPVAPPSWSDAVSAYKIEVPAGETSVYIDNPSGRVIADVVAVARELALIPDNVQAAPVATWLPDAVGYLIAPTWRSRAVVEVAPTQAATWQLDGHRERVQLQVRGLYSAPPITPDTVTVEVGGPRGVRTHVFEVPPEVAGPDRVGQEWEHALVGEPVDLPLDLGATDTSIRVSSESGRFAVAAHRAAPPREGWAEHRDGPTRRRHGTGVRLNSRPIAPEQGTAQVLWVQPRWEPSPEPLALPERWRTLHADGPVLRWLVPTDKRTGRVVCRLKGTTEVHLHELEDGVLNGWVWAPGARRRQATGGSYALLLDGEVWEAGRFQTAAHAFGGRSRHAETLSFVAPDGAVAWVKRHDPAECAAPHRVRETHHILPGQEHSWKTPNDELAYWVHVGGLSTRDAEVEVIVDGQLPQILRLQRSGNRGFDPDRPWHREDVLQGRGFSVTEGGREVRVRNTGTAPIEVFILIDGSHETTVGPLRVRG